MTNLVYARLADWVLRIAWFPKLPFPCRCRGRRRVRGTVTVEYVVLLGTVAVGLALAVAGLGVQLVRMYLSQTAQLALPFP
jgi:hypothetical protein